MKDNLLIDSGAHAYERFYCNMTHFMKPKNVHLLYY